MSFSIKSSHQINSINMTSQVIEEDQYSSNKSIPDNTRKQSTNNISTVKTGSEKGLSIKTITTGESNEDFC
jgi:hypothetical protein